MYVVYMCDEGDEYEIITRRTAPTFSLSGSESVWMVPGTASADELPCPQLSTPRFERASGL
jgi:hypothetical protein